MRTVVSFVVHITGNPTRQRQPRFEHGDLDLCSGLRYLTMARRSIVQQETHTVVLVGDMTFIYPAHVQERVPLQSKCICLLPCRKTITQFQRIARQRTTLHSLLMLLYINIRVRCIVAFVKSGIFIGGHCYIEAQKHSGERLSQELQLFSDEIVFCSHKH